MCLIVFSWQVISNYPLITIANRDEYYNRPSAAVAWWTDFPQVYAPRDLLQGGTWMGIARLNGSDDSAGHKFAAVTNVRDSSIALDNAPSRGKLVADFLSGAIDVEAYVRKIAGEMHQYNGFNLLVGEISPTARQLCWLSNRNTDNPGNGALLTPGIYGLSNGALDSPWPKVSKTKAEFASLLCQHAPQEAYFEMLSNTQPAPDCRLPDTGMSLQMEWLLSSTCIQSEHYGTRSSSFLKLSSQFGMEYEERVHQTPGLPYPL